MPPRSVTSELAAGADKPVFVLPEELSAFLSSNYPEQVLRMLQPVYPLAKVPLRAASTPMIPPPGSIAPPLGQPTPTPASLPPPEIRHPVKIEKVEPPRRPTLRQRERLFRESEEPERFFFSNAHNPCHRRYAPFQEIVGFECGSKQKYTHFGSPTARAKVSCTDLVDALRSSATAIRLVPRSRAPDAALNALADDPSLAFCFGLPGDVSHESVPRLRIQNTGRFMIRPLRAPGLRRPHRHHILRRFVIDQDLVIRAVVEVCSRIVNRMESVGTAKAFTDFERFATKTWPRPVVKASKGGRATIKALAPVADWRDSTRNMIDHYYQLIQEIMFSELGYVCEVLHVEKSDKDSPSMHR
jgi:hypothetical protein